MMNRFNNVANIEGNSVHISAMKITRSTATCFMATYYKSLATMYMIHMYIVCSKSNIVIMSL
jgi:hypothetical protein